MGDALFNWERLRILIISAVSPVLGYYTPTGGFLLALVVAFGLNIWAGMRADGVSITRCNNFSGKKIRQAMSELLLYLCIILTIYTIMEMCDDARAALLVSKSLTYVFIYVYMQNAFRNLIIAYPRTLALHIIYHVIRLEFTRALPSHIQPIIERYERIHGTEDVETLKDRDDDTRLPQ